MALIGSAIGWSMSAVGTLWSSVATVRSGRRTGATGQAQAVEGLGAGHLVDEVEVDVEQVGFARAGADDVAVPDLLGERRGRPWARHRCCAVSLSETLRSRLRGTRTVATVGVLDKAVAVLDALAPPGGPSPGRAAWPPPACRGPPPTGSPSPSRRTASCGRDGDGRFALGLRLVGLGRAAAARFPLAAGGPARARAARATRPARACSCSCRQADGRLCVESLESPHGLRWIVPVGAVLPLDRGSAGRVLSAGGRRRRVGGGARGGRGVGVGAGPRPRPGTSSPPSASPGRSNA